MISWIFPEIFFNRKSSFSGRVGVFCIFKCVFSQNNFHHELLPHRRFQLSQLCIYGHKILQSYSIMTDNLKRGWIFKKSVYFFFYGVRSWLLHFEYSEYSLISSKKTNHATNKKFQARFLPANCAEISKVTSGGGNWILRDLGPPEAKTFDLKYSSFIRLWNTTMKIWFRHHLENLTELEADHWKHCSNYTLTLRTCGGWASTHCIQWR